jgi:hypothetical protein
MRVPRKTIEELDKLGIRTITARTGSAVNIYNKEIQNNENLVACLHLTC